MKGLGGITATLAVLTAVTPSRSPAQESPVSPASLSQSAPVRLRMVIAPEIYEELGELADKKKTETVRCLLGVRDGDRLSINVAMEPVIGEATRNTVRYEACPNGTIALWHNHPAIKGLAPEHSCYLSAVDVQSAMTPNAPPVQIVQVRSGVMCWWIPRDFQGAFGAALLLPKPNQRIGQPVDLASVECSGPARVLPLCAGRRDVVATEGGSGHTAAGEAVRRIRISASHDSTMVSAIRTDAPAIRPPE